MQTMRCLTYSNESPHVGISLDRPEMSVFDSDPIPRRRSIVERRIMCSDKADCGYYCYLCSDTKLFTIRVMMVVVVFVVFLWVQGRQSQRTTNTSASCDDGVTIHLNRFRWQVVGCFWSGVRCDSIWPGAQQQQLGLR